MEYRNERQNVYGVCRTMEEEGMSNAKTIKRECMSNIIEYQQWRNM